jgi:hypothetical protein
VLSDIFENLEFLKSFIVGFWIPREENIIADYLSHYAKFCNVDKVEGYLSQISNLPIQKSLSSLSSSSSTSVVESVLNSNFYLPNNNLRIREGLNERRLHKWTNSESTFDKSSKSNSSKVCKILFSNRYGAFSDLTDMSSDVPIELHVSKRWVYSLLELRGFKTKEPLSSRKPSLVFSIRSPEASSMASKCSVQRSYTFEPERCINDEVSVSNVETSINFNFGRCKDRCHSLARSRRFASPRRFDFRVENIRHNLVPKSRGFRFESGSYENSSKRRSNYNTVSQSYGSLCGEENKSLFQIG